jgi:hypothetical protein
LIFWYAHFFSLGHAIAFHQTIQRLWIDGIWILFSSNDQRIVNDACQPVSNSAYLFIGKIQIR